MQASLFSLVVCEALFLDRLRVIEIEVCVIKSEIRELKSGPTGVVLFPPESMAQFFSN